MNEVSTERIHEILVATREYLTTHGWRRGGSASEAPHPPLCLGAAMVQVGGTGMYEYGACVRLLGFEPYTDPGSDDTLPIWNDCQASIEPVLARLDEGIAKTALVPEAPEATTELSPDMSNRYEVCM